MLNSVVLIGRLTADPELRTTNSNINVSRFSIAVDRQYNSNTKERKTDFINIVAWRQTADYVCKYFRKGSVIAVQGSLQIDSFTDKNGNKRNDAVVVATSVNNCGSWTNTVPATSAEVSTPTPNANAYQNSNNDDFANLNDDDLPF